MLAFAAQALAGAGVTPDPRPAPRSKRVYVLGRLVDAAPVIDGRLDDACWRDATGWSGSFRQLTPRYDTPASAETEIKVLSDARNLYVAIRARDGPLAGRSRQAGNRDGFAGDIVGINFDSYHDQRTGFEFDLTASGQQIDLRLLNNSWDTSWNAVWTGKVAHEADCWTAEFLIPLSQLRYDPANPVWGLHAWRWIDRLKEESDWNLLANDDSGFVKSFGELHGVAGLGTAHHVELLPYSSVRIEQRTGADRTKYRAGLDAKIGLSSNVTLDASLLPDFGQVEADPSVMNLTAFETFLTEKRPLFLEAKNIFDFAFNDDALFYSRRIGQAPAYRPPGAIEENPGATTLLGALKVSGKTGAGFSFGVLGAVTDRESVAVAADAGPASVAVAPRAVQLVARGQQDFRQGDTLLGAIVTHVRRDLPAGGLAEQLPEQATTAGVDLLHYWAEREYFVRAVAVVSDVAGDAAAIGRLQLASARYFQRPVDGADNYDPTRERLTGAGWWLKAGRASKGHWRWNGEIAVKTRGLELNDLGYLARADSIAPGASVSYVEKAPAAWYRSYELKVAQTNDWTTQEEYLGSGLEVDGSAELKNKWSVSGSLGARGPGRDPVALRGGPMLRVPAQWNWSASLATDGSRAVWGTLYLDGAHARYQAYGSEGAGGRISWRPVPALQLSAAVDLRRETDRQRFVATLPQSGSAGWLVSHLEGASRSLALRAEWHLRPEFSLQYYGNPFGATVRHREFRRVLAAGASAYAQQFGPVLPASWTDGAWMLDSDGDGTADFRLDDPDANAGSFRSNLVLRWEYRRGSTLYLVWAQQRDGAEGGKELGAWAVLDGLRRRPPANQLMLKVTYWFSS